MTKWTDEQTIAQSRATFTAHEADVDAEVAQRIALTAQPVSRRHWPVIASAAAVALMIAGVTLVAAVNAGHDELPATSPTRLFPGIGHPSRAGANRELALVAAMKALASIPVPAGSTRSDSAPAPLLRQSGCMCGSVDPRDGVVLSADKLTEPSPEFELAWQMHAAAFALSLPALGTTLIGAALATHARRLTPRWQLLLGVAGGALLFAAGAASLAIAGGSTLLYVGAARLLRLDRVGTCHRRTAGARSNS